MYNIFLNEQPFPINTFSRNTYFNQDGTITSNGTINLAPPYDTAAMHTLAQDTITSLVIKNEQLETLYSAGEIAASIISIDETIGENYMNFTANLKF